MGELPVGWRNTTVGKIAFVCSGVGFPKKFQGIIDEKYPVYKVGDVSTAFLNNKGKLDKAGNYVSPQTVQELKGRVFNVGATLFAKIGEALKLNRRVILKREGLVDNNVMGVKAYEGDMDYFVFRFLQLFDIASLSRSTTVPSIRKGDVEEIIFPLPPLNEQIRIANKLDTLLAKVEAAQTRLEKIPTLLKRFRQSVLAAATSGELTREWRERHASNWRTIQLGQLLKRSPQNGLYKPAKLYGKGTKIVRIDGFYDGELKEWDSFKELFIEPKELDCWKLEVNDILINRVNSIEYLGKCGLVRTLPSDTVFESNIMRISVKVEEAYPDYVTIFLSSHVGLSRLRKNAKHAVNQASINQTDVKNCMVEIPFLEEQKEIVRRVEALFVLADSVEKQYQQAFSRLKPLLQSILAKGFRGELVPQDPNDEPAEQLLARIQAEREKQKPAKKSPKSKKNNVGARFSRDFSTPK